MELFSAIESRRSVKHYDPNFEMPPEDIRKILEAALLSPTSFNMQNWRFLVVTDPEIRQSLCEAAWNQAQVKDASFTLLLCGDLKAHERDPARYWKDAPKAAADLLVPMIPGFYANKPGLQRDEVMRSCGIAAQTVMLAAKGLGYDSCPMIGFDAEKVAEIIQLPEDYAIGLMITVGKALKPAWPRPGQLPYDEVVFSDTFAK